MFKVFKVFATLFKNTARAELSPCDNCWNRNIMSTDCLYCHEQISQFEESSN